MRLILRHSSKSGHWRRSPVWSLLSHSQALLPCSLVAGQSKICQLSHPACPSLLVFALVSCSLWTGKGFGMISSTFVFREIGRPHFEFALRHLWPYPALAFPGLSTEGWWVSTSLTGSLGMFLEGVGYMQIKSAPHSQEYAWVLAHYAWRQERERREKTVGETFIKHCSVSIRPWGRWLSTWGSCSNCIIHGWRT